MTSLRQPFDEKYVRRMTMRELVRLLLEGTESAAEKTRNAIESSSAERPITS
jgi:hypothetical protein